MKKWEINIQNRNLSNCRTIRVHKLFWHISMPISQLKWYMMVCWISICKYICVFKMPVYTWFGSKKYLESHRSFHEIKVRRDICRFLRWLSNKIFVKNSREIADALMRNQKSIDPILWLSVIKNKSHFLFGTSTNCQYQ